LPPPPPAHMTARGSPPSPCAPTRQPGAWLVVVVVIAAAGWTLACCFCCLLPAAWGLQAGAADAARPRPSPCCCWRLAGGRVGRMCVAPAHARRPPSSACRGAVCPLLRRLRPQASCPHRASVCVRRVAVMVVGGGGIVAGSIVMRIVQNGVVYNVCMWKRRPFPPSPDGQALLLATDRLRTTCPVCPKRRYHPVRPPLLLHLSCVAPLPPQFSGPMIEAGGGFCCFFRTRNVSKRGGEGVRCIERGGKAHERPEETNNTSLACPRPACERGRERSSASWWERMGETEERGGKIRSARTRRRRRRSEAPEPPSDARRWSSRHLPCRRHTTKCKIATRPTTDRRRLLIDGQVIL
jgi:hypothetical protein